MGFQTSEKKLLSLALVLIMLISIFAIPIPASAATSGDYEYAILNDGTAEITGYNGSATELELPNSIDYYTFTSIGDASFEYCDSLETVIIPDSITNIGSWAFDGCKNLANISIPYSVTSIGFAAFYHCSSLTSVTIPNSVTSIDEAAFGYYLKNFGEIGKVENFTIKGYNGTEAERYSTENGFAFVSLGDVPTTDEPSETTPTVAKTIVSVKNAPKTIYVKGMAKINADVKNGKGATTYKSSNTKVAKVSASGKITALKKGTATITLTNNGSSKSFKITVKNPKLNKTKKTLKKGAKFMLKITGKVGTPKFSSNNKKVATVNKKGKIIAKKKGKATITVKTNGMKLKCTIKVK